MRNAGKALTVIPCVFLALVAGCVLNGISGSGTIAEERRNVSGFSNISLSGAGRLLIEQTGAESLTIAADDNLLPHIKSEVHGSTLELGNKDFTRPVQPSKDITYKLTVKNIRRVDVSGSGSVDANGLQTERLDIAISGSGKVTASGNADDLEIRISGSGDYLGEGLKSKRADVDISGSGRAVIAVSEKLDADVSGSGSIQYIGEPRVQQHVSGSGSVRRR
jgi:hypothetical protein